MDCLKNYIGIAELFAPVSPPVDGVDTDDIYSGLTINQLPGITFKSIEKLADADQENYLGVWQDVQQRAILKFMIAFKARMNVKHRISGETVISCLVCSNKKIFSIALWYLMGVEMMIERTASERLNRYTTIDLDKAEKLKAEFHAEYLSAFDDAMDSMQVAGSDCIDSFSNCSGDLISFVESSL